MICPYCQGETSTIKITNEAGQAIEVQRCTECGGFWFDQLPKSPLNPESVHELESAQPSYSLQHPDIFCPKDSIFLEDNLSSEGPVGRHSYTCSECGGVFYPRGQLALLTGWQQHQATPANSTVGLKGRQQAVTTTALLMVLIVSSLASLARGNLALTYQAATNQPLPTAGPNLLTLSLLAATYIAGTVLAVLGRRLPIIIVGWCVIVICLFGFSVLIFSS